jgi:hypothetical protein
MNVLVVAIIACCAIARLIVSSQVPLTEDEAYYWQWSRHLAPGYTDHPPAVAWLIAPFAPFGSPAFIRLGFVLCGVVAALALADAVRILAHRHGVDAKPAAVASVCAFSFAPVTWFSFGTAMPDGPYLAAWCVTLWAAVHVDESARRRDMIVLGLALGIALLSRAFGFALLAGVLGWSLLPARRRLWGSGLWLTFVIAALVYAPFVMWNVTHDWANVTFSLYQRNEVHTLRLSRLWPLAYGAILMYSPGLWLAAICMLTGLWFIREPIVAWTAFPLAIVLTVLASFETVEQHWYLGVYTSLCIAMGLCYARTQPYWRRVWERFAMVPALGMLLIGATAAAAPAQTYAAVRGLTHLTLRNDGPFEVYAYRMLAGDIAALRARSDAGIMTTSYGLAAELNYHRGLVPVVIGDDYRGRESRRWQLTTAEGRMIVVERAPLSDNPSLQRLLGASCRQLTPGPVLHYRFADAPARSFYTTYCIGIGSREIAALRAVPPSH